MPALPPIAPLGDSTRFRNPCKGSITECFHRDLPGYDTLNAHATRHLGRRVGFTDIDALLEVNGRLLLLEHKGPGVSLKPGQGPALRELTAASTRITVIVNRPAGDGYSENLVMAGGDIITPGGWSRWSHEQFWTWFDEWLTLAKMSSPQRPQVRA